MSRTANIAHVTVDGIEVDRYFDLDTIAEFAFTTDRGNSYRVVVANDSDSEREWTVTRLDSGHETEAGTVTHQKPFLIFGSSAHRYFTPGATMSSGSQNDLWNAVQSLAE